MCVCDTLFKYFPLRISPGGIDGPRRCATVFIGSVGLPSDAHPVGRPGLAGRLAAVAGPGATGRQTALPIVGPGPYWIRASGFRYTGHPNIVRRHGLPDRFNVVGVHPLGDSTRAVGFGIQTWDAPALYASRPGTLVDAIDEREPPQGPGDRGTVKSCHASV
jgi:hypothetical protein